MLDYAREGVVIAQGKTLGDLQKDRMMQLSLLHLVGLIGEAASRVSKPTRLKHLEIDWKAIIGMRNKIIHDYAITDLEILWKTVESNLPDLSFKLEKIISEHGS